MLRGLGLRHGFRGETVLSGVDITVDPREVVSIQGRSGSGKSTLLHILAGLLLPDSGKVEFGGRVLTDCSETERAAVRLTHFGFIFQTAGLVPEFTAIENVELPLLLLGSDPRRAREESLSLLDEFGLAAHAEKRLPELSGGQYQRVAVARALVHEPRVVFADEPTGSLDPDAAGLVLDAMLGSVGRRQTAVLMVTHDPEVAERADRILHLVDGLLK